jgi:hypothetical protein
MTMKKLILIFTLVALAAVPLEAQTYLSTTTLSAAVTSQTQRTITVASASGIAAGGQLFIDHELMDVVSVSGTTITVNRFTNPSTHNSAAVVIIAPAAAKSTAFVPNSGVPRAGSCTPSNYAYLPIVNTDTGDVWLCWAQGSSGPNASRLWHVTNTLSNNGVYSLLVNLQ